MVLKNKLLFALIVIFSFCVKAEGDGFIIENINKLLRDKITDQRLVIEPEFSSNAKLDSIKSKQDKIDSIDLQEFDAKDSTFRVLVHYTDGKSDSLAGKYKCFVMVPVTAKYIKFGDIIQQSDITTQKVLAGDVEKENASEIAQVVGMQAKKYIAVGKMIKIAEIASPNVIKPNDPVNIIYSSGPINLKTVGVAMGSGAVGDMVKVKNESSGAILLGQIINKNTVKIGGDNE